MRTGQEYADDPRPVLWIHAIDLFAHVLQGDTKKTAFKNTGANREYINSLIAKMGTLPDLEAATKAELETTYKDLRSKDVKSENGDFSVERFIEGEKRLLFDESTRLPKDTPGRTIVFEMAVNGGDRGGTWMKKRFDYIYRLALDSEADGIPCRVIGAVAISCQEYDSPPLRIYMVIKDYPEPIFAGIWGALQDNAITNDLLNAIMDYLIGTHSGGNGTCTGYMIDADLESDEDIVIIDPRYLETKHGRKEASK